MKALEILKKCKSRLEEMTQEEFNTIVVKRKLDNIDYNCEQYLDNDFEIILPTENCVHRVESIKDVVEYTTKNSSLNEYKNLYMNYKDFYEERKNSNNIYISYREINLSKFLDSNSCIYENDYIYTDVEIIDNNIPYKSNPQYRESAWNDMDQGDSLVKAA